MTTYYVRTIADDFNYNLQSAAYGYSLTSHFQTYGSDTLPTSGSYDAYGMKPNRLFGTTDQVLYGFTDNLTNRAQPPAKTTISSSNVIVVTGTSGGDGGAFFWSNRDGDPVSPDTGYGMERWGGRGWTNPFSDYSTWITELCTAFDTININSVVTLNANINLVICKYKFNNAPTASGRYFLFPIFYVGNDPRYDSTVVV